MRASAEGHVATVKVLLTNVLVDINAQNAFGDTALRLAHLKGHTEVVNLLSK